VDFVSLTMWPWPLPMVSQDPYTVLTTALTTFLKHTLSTRFGGL